MNTCFLFDETLPACALELLDTEPLKRIGRIDMNCGMNYTSVIPFAKMEPYTRLSHSIGVSMILWHYTRDEKQMLAGLVHDIAAPAFSHVIDFMHGDHTAQEYTEGPTYRIIHESPEMQDVLKQHGFRTEDITPDDQYPLANSNGHVICADRLEYTLGNAMNYGYADKDRICWIMSGLAAGFNEHDVPEFVFQHRQQADAFAWLALQCGRTYSCDADRYGMERLAVLLKKAVKQGILCEADLMKDEPHVIQKLLDSSLKEEWLSFRRMKDVVRLDVYEEGALKADAKKRYIDPYAIGQGRVSAWDDSFHQALHEFEEQSYDVWLKGICL
ncbi:MAG: hypothetical protein VZT48_00625 [Bulleidia sp.]|nr:hypothetical protein [Bulleidia sp.]